MDKVQLIPLRIPTGFAVCYNKFYDVEPIKSEETDDFIENWGFFTQDLLQIVKMDINKGSWHIPTEHIVIDLGWYPDSSPDGTYSVELVAVGGENRWDTIKQM